MLQLVANLTFSWKSNHKLKICLLLTGVPCEMLLNGYSWCVCDLTEAVCVRFTGKTAEWEWCSFKTWWMTDQNPSCRITSFLCIFKSRFQNKLLFCSLVGDSDNSATQDIIARGANPGILGQGREHAEITNYTPLYEACARWKLLDKGTTNHSNKSILCVNCTASELGR